MCNVLENCANYSNKCSLHKTCLFTVIWKQIEIFFGMSITWVIIPSQCKYHILIWQTKIDLSVSLWLLLSYIDLVLSIIASPENLII